ncbi:MAG: hypothetical protein HZC42_02520 [Candidatus Eisenbacteria bacterium]|nr:hypothetical protein [Candidatus Eisenbacteria bacterium]
MTPPFPTRSAFAIPAGMASSPRGRRRPLRLAPLPFALGAALAAATSSADTVIPFLSYVRPTAATNALIHPTSGTSAGGASSTVRYAVGDILAFRIALTPIPSGAPHGLQGYVTAYVPGNTQVVGARFVDAAGNTVPPRRGGIAPTGTGSRGAKGYVAPLLEGRLAGLHADVGIFYSTDARTARTPDDQVLTVANGIAMSPAPTGAGQVGPAIGVPSGTYYVHNQWDWAQARAFGSGAVGSVTPAGNGNTPRHSGSTGHGYGSPVAGPNTLYGLEATETSPGVVQAIGAAGPWQRIRATGSEVGTGPVPQPSEVIPNPGTAGRNGVSTASGWDLSPANPLPAGTRAVRFAVGELETGEEYFAEISLKVLGSPLDPVMGDDVLCVEAFGGDASGRSQDGSAGGKDNPWRYCVPSTASAKLGLRFELDADRDLAASGDAVTFTLTAQNLTLSAQTNVVLSLDLSTSAAMTFVSATGTPSLAGDVLTWPAVTLMPGDLVSHTIVATASGSNTASTSVASYVSTQLPAPGLTARRVVNLRTVSDLRPALSVAPAQSGPADFSYTATIYNAGNGSAGSTGCALPGCMAIATLPAGFHYVSGTARINGVPVADPAVGADLRFTSGLPATLGAGGTTTITFDVAVDDTVSGGSYTSTFETWLRDVGMNLTVEDEVSGAAAVATGVGVPVGEPTAARLLAVSPNPFHSQAAVVFELARPGPVSLDVYDIRGARVRRLCREAAVAGRRTVLWDGTDDAGRALPSGVYLVRMEAGLHHASRMTVWMR